MDVLEPLLRSRASVDCTTCLICQRRITADEDKEYVYRDDKLAGAIHASHYEAVQARYAAHTA